MMGLKEEVLDLIDILDEDIGLSSAKPEEKEDLRDTLRDIRAKVQSM